MSDLQIIGITFVVLDFVIFLSLFIISLSIWRLKGKKLLLNENQLILDESLKNQLQFNKFFTIYLGIFTLIHLIYFIQAISILIDLYFETDIILFNFYVVIEFEKGGEIFISTSTILSSITQILPFVLYYLYEKYFCHLNMRKVPALLVFLIDLLFIIFLYFFPTEDQFGMEIYFQIISILSMLSFIPIILICVNFFYSIKYRPELKLNLSLCAIAVILPIITWFIYSNIIFDIFVVDIETHVLITNIYNLIIRIITLTLVLIAGILYSLNQKELVGMNKKI